MLSDGGWHNREQLLANAMLFVPYGQAVRKATASRMYGEIARRRRGNASAQRLYSRMDSHIVGARSVVTQVLANWLRDGNIECRDGENGELEYRLVAD
jgi:hypothetical protein